MGFNSYIIRHCVKWSYAHPPHTLPPFEGRAEKMCVVNAASKFPSIYYSFFYLICFIWYCSKSQKEKQTNGIMLLKCRRTSKHKMKIAAYIHYSPIHRIFGISSAYTLHAGMINSDAAATATAAEWNQTNHPNPTVKHTNFLMVYSVCALWILYSPGFFVCSRHRFVFVFCVFFCFHSAVPQQQIVVCIFLTISSEI